MKDDIITIDQQYREKILASQGLESLDQVEGFGEEVCTQVGNILELRSLELKRNIKFDIDQEAQSVTLKTTDGRLIGYIRPGYYTYGKVSVSEHLERKVFDEFLSQGFGQLLQTMYELQGFYIPRRECSHKPSTLAFLMANGYSLIGVYDDNGQIQELDEIERLELESLLTALKQSGDHDLPHTYLLQYVGR